MDSAVFEQLGRVILEAQALEEALVRENLALDSHATNLNPAAVAALEQKLGKQNLGGLLKHWQGKVTVGPSLLAFLEAARDDRNLLAHRLFRHPEPKKTGDYLSEISQISARLKAAQYLVYAHNPKMKSELDAQWAVTEADRNG